jgi:tetratricopeptide (TPR) repeat protein
MVVSLMLFFACRPAVITPPSPLEPPSSGVRAPGPPPERPEAVKNELHQREQVAAALTAQGRQRLDAGQVDKAIRIFEQALSQSPHYGPGYYYLAESWLRKNNGSQARAFHDQAQLYLHEQPAWRMRLERQQKEIERGVSELAIP